MANVQPSTQLETHTFSRLVWVLNRDLVPYRAEFQGVKIEIPAENQKIAKKYTEGGNLFDFVTGNQFKSDLKQPQGFSATGEPIFGPKALHVVELTEAEREKFEGKSEAQLKKEALADEKKVRRSMKAALDKIPNKVLVAEDEDA